jgi:hypothetical protein
MDVFEPDRHEPLSAAPWDEAHAREAIAGLVAEIEAARIDAARWPLHPLDDEGDRPVDGAFKGLYLGSAGLLWALWFLQREGAVALRQDPAASMAAVHAAYGAAPDSGELVPSYYLGEVGILLARWRMTDDASLLGPLHDAVRANIANPTNEALWAAPGTMVAAWHLWRATADERWRTLFLENVEQLWRTWQLDAAASCHLWTQDLYGSVVQYLGAGHGFAGNAHALLLGAELLGDERRELLYRRCEATLGAFARHDDVGGVNWPPATALPRPGRPQVLMQWCHGAPGIVTAFAPYPPRRSATVDALLLGAGHAIWRAGPLRKGPGLCHGTAGNALALLALHRRTGDAVWLERARTFAMHAIEQSERMRAQHGQPRCSLWTGDAGLAVILWQCIRARAGVPSLDYLD